MCYVKSFDTLLAVFLNFFCFLSGILAFFLEFLTMFFHDSLFYDMPYFVYPPDNCNIEYISSREGIMLLLNCPKYRKINA
jgi:hypothetical protein